MDDSLQSNALIKKQFHPAALLLLGILLLSFTFIILNRFEAKIITYYDDIARQAAQIPAIQTSDIGGETSSTATGSVAGAATPASAPSEVSSNAPKRKIVQPVPPEPASSDAQASPAPAPAAPSSSPPAATPPPQSPPPKSQLLCLPLLGCI